jgi:hypothetical protein
VAGSVCLRSDFIELPDSPDPFASQDRQGKLFGEGVGAGHPLCPPRFGIAVDLVSGASQTGNTVAVHIPLPGQQLINRESVAPARLVYRNPATAHGLN